MLTRTLIAALAAASVLVRPGNAASPWDFNVPCDSTGYAGTPFVRGINCRVVPVEGYPRQYIVYVPRSPAFLLTKERPVVVVYHGSNGSASSAFNGMGWWQKAEAERFVAVFGSGLTYQMSGRARPASTRRTGATSPSIGS
jgi:poly(3-hydroxybutyrate) depolymerase